MICTCIKTTVYINSVNGVLILGLPSPALDFAESRISIDAKFINHPAATYFCVPQTFITTKASLRVRF
nr:MAG TPA: DNA polymerase V subunit UmuD [Caudoviricetes sp.]